MNTNKRLLTAVLYYNDGLACKTLPKIRKNIMDPKVKSIKYLLTVFLLTTFNIFCNAQNDTISKSIISTNLNEPKWSFSDTLISQLNKNETYKNWSRIIFVDEVSPKYLRTTSIVSIKRRVNIVDTAGTKLDAISKRKIDQLLFKLVKEVAKSDSNYFKGYLLTDPLNQYELDSVWYKENIISIWNSYSASKSIKLDSTQIKIASRALLNYKELDQILRFPNNWNPDESVMIDLKIEYPFDTLHLQAASAFALPWYYFNNQTRLSNSKISQLVGELLGLTQQESNNLNRLSGRNFEMLLMEDIYKRYLKKII